MAQPDLSADRARAFALVPISRETENRLDAFVAVFREWQSRINLIAASTEASLWTRHIADSLQLVALAPEARRWVDLGSGAGFPGMVIACALASSDRAQVHLIESNGKKAAFLREAVAIVGVPAVVHAARVEDALPALRDGIDVVTARALAPLPKLLAMAAPLLKKGAMGLFPKGQHVAAELTEASKCWTIQAALAPSVTSSQSRIVVVRALAAKR